jgi:ATP-dependent DNA helicase PIF1
MRQLRLIKNMRAQSDEWFADYLLRVGNGTEETDEDGNIRLPEDICVSSTGDNVADIKKLIDHVFPTLDHNMDNPHYMTSRAILSTRNDSVDAINMHMIERFKGEERIYYSLIVRRMIRTATTLKSS